MQAAAPLPPSALSDLAIKSHLDDRLGFRPYAESICNLILGPNTSTPLTIGILGSWGSGKTSLMKMIGSLLEEQAGRPAAAGALPPVPIHPVWFNAWLFSKEDSLWRALLTQTMLSIMDVPVTKGRGQKKQLDDRQALYWKLRKDLYRVTAGGELGSLSIRTGELMNPAGANTEDAQITLRLQQGLDLLEGMAAHGGTPVGAGDSASMLRQRVRDQTLELEQERIQSLESFRRTFEELVSKFVQDGYLVVFVDDLDRCLPDKAIEVLEAIKLFMDVQRCIFLLAIDSDVIERGIRLRYGEIGAERAASAPFLLSPEALADSGNARAYRRFLEELAGPRDHLIDGARYLEKIIQIPFVLPPINAEAMTTFVREQAPDLPHTQLVDVFVRGLEPNPRQVKRVINIFRLLWDLAPKRGISITPVRLGKMIVLQQRHRELYDQLREDPELLVSAERFLRREFQPEAFDRWRAARGEPADKVEMPEALRQYAEIDALRELLLMQDLEGPLSVDANFVDLPPGSAAAYVFLTSSATSSPSPTGTVQEATKGAIRVDAEASAGVGATDTATVVDADLDVQTIGLVKSKVYYVMDDLQRWPTSEAEPGIDIRPEMLGALAAAGGEAYLTITRDPERRSKLEAELPEPGGTVRIAAARGEDQLPWEVMYDEPLAPSRLMKQAASAPAWSEISRDGFWGYRYVIERPLKSLDTPSTGGPVPPLRPLPSMPTVAIAMGLGSDEPDAARTAILQQWADEGRIALRQLTTVRELLDTLAQREADIVYLHGRASSDNPREITIPMRDGAFTRRELEGLLYGASSSGSGSEASQLLLLDVEIAIGRHEEWARWQGLLKAIGVTCVVCPMTAPKLEWSTPFVLDALDKLLRGRTVGEALLQARLALREPSDNPLGLLFASFGAADLRGAPAEPVKSV